MRTSLILWLLVVASITSAQRLAFEKSRFDGDEGASVTVTVTLSETLNEAVQVPFETVAVSAQAARDFLMNSGTLTFAPGERVQTFEVVILDDEKFEGEESFNVVLGKPTGASLSYLSTASVRILDNDPEVVGLLEDFETSDIPFGGEGTRLREIPADSALALPEQGDFETVLHVEGGVLERRYNLAQDWSGSTALSFWYYGQGTGDAVTVELASARAEVADEDWPLAWSDEFEAEAGTPPDPGVWNYDLGGGGWGNGEWQFYTDNPENAAHDGAGNLVITALELPEDNGLGCHYGECRYTSARLHTADKLETLYGRVEARLKLPQGQGLWPAFWMLGNDFASVGWPTSGEIDVMELIGREPNAIHGHLHGPGYSGGGGPGGAFVDADGFADAFHVYAVEWEPGEIRWYVDSEHYLSIGANDVNGEWVYDHPFFLLLNVAVGGSWPGYPDETTRFPQQLVADYVRVYALPDTSARFEARFLDEAEGWQNVMLPFSTFTDSGAQTAPLDLSEIWGYRLQVPGEAYIDQITLEKSR